MYIFYLIYGTESMNERNKMLRWNLWKWFFGGASCNSLCSLMFVIISCILWRVYFRKVRNL